MAEMMLQYSAVDQDVVVVCTWYIYQEYIHQVLYINQPGLGRLLQPLYD